MKNKILAKRLGVIIAVSMLFISGCSGSSTEEANNAVIEEKAEEQNEGIQSEEQQEESVQGEEQQEEIPSKESGQEERQEEKEQEKEAEAEEAAKKQQEEAEKNELEVAKTRYYYAEILSKLYFTGMLPDDSEVETDYANLAENEYAVLDVDGDGREELLISITDASMAGMQELVYAYNPESGEVNQKLAEFPNLTYYDNGAVMAGWSHNQGLGESLWPFTLYQYDEQGDTYQEVGSVDSWEKSYREEDFEGNRFPDESDTDKDGILYYISQPGEYNNNRPVNKNEYMQWLDSYVGDADTIDVSYQKMELDNFCDYTKKYLELVRKQNKESQQADADMGIYFMENEPDIEEVESVIAAKYPVEISESDELEHIGILNGKDVFSFFYENAGSFTYQNEQVEDLTIFGVYPGMSEQDAISCLEKFGFYSRWENGFVTGDGWGNYSVWLNCENGTVIGIRIGSYCGYVG